MSSFTLVILTHLYLYKSESLKLIDYKVYDFIKEFISREDKSDSSNVLIVDIDEKSISALGQWPWPRIIMAQLLSKIDRYHPSAVGFDIVFPEKDRTSPSEIITFYEKYFHLQATVLGLDKKLQDNDVLFADEIRKSGAILSLYMSQNDIITAPECYDEVRDEFEVNKLELFQAKSILCNTSILQKAASKVGYINTTKDEDGILRRAPLLWQYDGYTLSSFGVSILSSIDPSLSFNQNDELTFLNHTIRMDKDATVLLHYYNENWYKKVSAVDILRGDIDPAILQGKIILVGSSAVALHDQIVIPGGQTIAGVKVNVTLLDNAINNHLLVQPEKYKKINLAVSLVFILLILYLLITKRNMISILFFFGAISIYLLGTFLYFREGIYLSLGYFLFPFILHFFIISIFEILFDIFERKLFIEELNRSHIALLDSMVHVAEVHDIETGAHIIRTKKYVKYLGEYLYKKGFYRNLLSPLKIEIIYRTASLHDLGKVGIPDAILKKPGKLTPIEFEVMKTHPMLGVHIINNAIKSYNENDFFLTARNIAHYHHEKFDGSGYPEGLKGQEIPIEARLMALADVYDALISRRVYKESFGYKETIDIIIQGRGTHFDPILVDAFLECENEFMEIAELYNDAKYKKED